MVVVQAEVVIMVVAALLNKSAFAFILHKGISKILGAKTQKKRKSNTQDKLSSPSSSHAE